MVWDWFPTCFLRTQGGFTQMRSILLYVLGVPIPLIILIALVTNNC